MDNKKRILITISMGIALVLVFYFVSYSISKYTGFLISDETNNFESCLLEKQITLYINSDDSDLTLKNIELSKYLKDFKIFNCRLNNEVCIEEGVNGPFPTWIIEGNKIEGDISISELARYSGCKM